MSGDGHAARSTGQLAIAFLAVAGFVLLAAVVPALGGQAPGGSLVPELGAGDGAGDGAATLQGSDSPSDAPGEQGAAGAGGSESLVGGLVGRLSGGESSGVGDGSAGRTGGGSSGGGESGFGALNPGRQTGVGSNDGLTSRGLRSQSQTPHFVVESSAPTYWRTGAYDVYTGSGWEATGSATERRWPLPIETAADDRRTILQRYKLLQPASALPAAWEPVSVEDQFSLDVEVTPQRALRASGRLPANTSYTVRSEAPPRDPARLRAAGTRYPAAIERIYTALPDGTPDRVRRLTDRVTANASTPYESAVAIERWLESNKGYSLGASHEGGRVVDSFLFEMDVGYCEYFATAMATMLRTQGVPARYVVGYSTGQPVANDTYLVRAMNAHAWVEVYFPETGWVRFDPTPGQRRLANEARAYQRMAENDQGNRAARRFLEQVSRGSPPSRESTDSDRAASRNRSDESDPSEASTDEYDHNESGSPGESFDAASESGYAISLASDPVPGTTVTVLVERGGEPAPGVAVSFNGDRVGVTDVEGTVRAEVPFTARLRIDVREAGGVGGASAALAPMLGPAAGPSTDPSVAALAPSLDRSVQTSGEPGGTNASRTFSVPTAIDVRVDGTPRPSETVRVRATIANRSVRDATVTLDGSRVGRTDDSGTLAVTLPPAETTTVAVERGEASGNVTLELADVQVNTSGFALPGLALSVSVTDRGKPVEGATVTVGGRTATTGPNGQATVTLPVATGATVRVETPGGIVVTRSVAYQFLAAGVVVAVVLSLLVATVALRRRAVAAGRSFGEQIAVAARWLSGIAVAALVGAAVRAEDVLTWIPTALRQGLAGVRVATGALRSKLLAAAAALVAAVRDREIDRSALPDPRTLLAALLARLRRFVAGVRATGPSAKSDAERSASVHGPAESTVTGEPDARERIRRTWRAFRERVPVEDHRSKTPGELARAGIDAGFPESSVTTLRDAVRAIEYGRRDPGRYLDDVARVADALDRLDDDRSTTATDGSPRVTDGGDSPAEPNDAGAADGGGGS